MHYDQMVSIEIGGSYVVFSRSEFVDEITECQVLLIFLIVFFRFFRIRQEAVFVRLTQSILGCGHIRIESCSHGSIDSCTQRRDLFFLANHDRPFQHIGHHLHDEWRF